MGTGRLEDAASVAAAMDAADKAFFSHGNRGCCCFFSGISGGGKVWERIRPASSNTGEVSDRWWMKMLLKIREWSELLPGPRWKTFIRRFRRNCYNGSSGSGCGGGINGRRGRFEYDPLSYAMNFDEDGHGHWDGNGDGDIRFLYPDFSARFAMPPASAKSSMDLGNGGGGGGDKDSPPLFLSSPASAVTAH